MKARGNYMPMPHCRLADDQIRRMRRRMFDCTLPH